MLRWAASRSMDNKLYTVATIDYLADGNGSMEAFLQADDRVCPEGATLRGLFLDYVRQQTAARKEDHFGTGWQNHCEIKTL